MKICIVQIGQLGDMILLSPLFRALAERLPSAKLHALCSPKNSALARASARISRVYEFDKRPFALPALLWRLRAERYDFWLDPKDHFSRQGSFLAQCSNPKTSVGFNKIETHKIGIKPRFSIGIETAVEDFSLHQTEQNLKILEKIGIKPTSQNEFSNRPELALNPDSERYVGAILAEKSPIVLNISAGNDSRRWQEEKWSGLANALAAVGWETIISCEPRHADRASEILRLAPAAKIFPSRSIFDVISLISRARLLVSPDTAPVHIAAAFDAPVVGLYPNVEWNFHKFRPLSSRSAVVRAKGETLDDISEESVRQAVFETLK